VQGVQRLKDIDFEQHSANTLFLPRFVFIAPPSLATLQERLIARGTESAESLQRRVANAKAEVDYGLEQGNFDAIIVNDDLRRAARELADTIENLYAK
jgi:guanylate kinase